MTFVGFKRLTVRILDGGTPTLDTNLFVVEGKSGEGATQTAKITGMSNDPVKTYGSNVAYSVSNRGVGDAKVELTLVDLPQKLLNKILGYKEEDGLVSIGVDTVAPFCSILMESSKPNGKKGWIGFFKGQFSMDGLDLETIKEKQEELSGETLTFSAIASDEESTKGLYRQDCYDDNAAEKLKQHLQMVASA